MGLREQKKAALRRRLYETAMALFRERGFAATRIRDVIDQVQVSEATFFNYFPTKEAVLDQLSIETKRFYIAYVHNLIARDTEPAPDRLRELARVVASIFSSDREFMATVLANTNLFFGATGEAKDLDVESQRLVADLFRQGQDRGEFGVDHDPLQLAEIFSAAFLLTILNWVLDWFGEPAEDVEDRVVRAIDVILRGCEAR
ncbi:MAG: hypothetical protein QOF21_266 [Actinomycetota bacterium]|jgi:AcrR family transcriptional regulator